MDRLIERHARSRGPRPGWHRLYYVLAAFDVLTVVLSLLVSHQIRGIYANSVEVNQVWGQRLSDFSDLGQLAQGVNAPGNDVFDTLDVESESAKMRAALAVFDERVASLHADVRAYHSEVSGSGWDDFEQDFDRLTAAMADMTDQADLLFSDFQQQQPEAAGRQMATMDRKYANVNRVLADIRQDVSAIQLHNFDQQEAVAASLATLDYVIAAFILFMVSGATLYGHKMARQAETDAREYERSVAERNRLYAALSERERKLEELVRRLFAVQEEERRRMAYDVHDGLAQLATAVQQHIEAFAGRVRPRAAEARADLARARELAQQTVREARWLIAGLRPTALDDFGLAAAIRLELDTLRTEGWHVTYAEELGSRRLPTETETALFRVAQEALRNVRKHSGTSRVYVALRGQVRAVHLEVRDWGRGFSRTPRSGNDYPGVHVGIPSMQERVALLGGHCSVTSRVGNGTHVLVEVPVGALT